MAIGALSAVGSIAPRDALAVCPSGTGRTDTTLNYFFTGWERVGAWDLVAATMLNRDATAVGDAVTNWVMLDDNTTTATHIGEYVQVGQWNDPNGSQWLWAEFSYPPNSPEFIDYFWGNTILNTYDNYGIEDPNTGLFRLYWRNVYLTSVPRVFFPQRAEIYAETHNAASQSPGTPTDPFDVQNATLSAVGDVSHVAFNGIASATNTNYQNYFVFSPTRIQTSDTCHA